MNIGNTLATNKLELKNKTDFADHRQLKQLITTKYYTKAEAIDLEDDIDE
jgi:hypothetical protein